MVQLLHFPAPIITFIRNHDEFNGTTVKDTMESLATNVNGAIVLQIVVVGQSLAKRFLSLAVGKAMWRICMRPHNDGHRRHCCECKGEGQAQYAPFHGCIK